MCFSLNQYYEFATSGAWRSENAEECGCKGSGWFLSNVDTVHRCAIHASVNDNPYDYSYDDDDGEEAQKAKASDIDCVRVLVKFFSYFDTDDIPF